MKIDRRALLKSTAVVSVAALAPGFSIAALADTERGIERFVFDARFAAAIEAGRAAAARGIQTSGVDGDLTSLWYDDLNLRWRQQPMTLAGVTAEDALFVLSTLAPEYRMRVVQQESVGLARVPGATAGKPLSLYAWVIAPVSQGVTTHS